MWHSQAGAVLHKVAHGVAAGLCDLLQQLHVGQHALVVARVDLLNLAPNALGQQARQALDGRVVVCGAGAAPVGEGVETQGRESGWKRVGQLVGAQEEGEGE